MGYIVLKPQRVSSPVTWWRFGERILLAMPLMTTTKYTIDTLLIERLAEETNARILIDGLVSQLVHCLFCLINFSAGERLIRVVPPTYLSSLKFSFLKWENKKIPAVTLT